MHEFDVEAADAAILADETTEVVEPVEDEILDGADVEADPIEDEEVAENEETEAQPDITTDDGRDVAFANLRRERDQNAADAEFIRQFAEKNGMTVEELKKQHAQAALEKEAEEKGVPVDILNRLNTMERENQTIKEQAQAERFNAQVASTMAKYGGKQEDFNHVVKFAAENGMLDAVRSGSISFEAAYKLAKMDDMIADAKKNAVQDDLATRKKRQQEASVPTGSQSQVVETDDIDEQAAKDAAEILKEMNF